MITGKDIADMLKGKARYQEGQVWQQKNGAWVTKKNGKIIKVKKGRKKKKKDVAADHAAAAHEEEKQTTKKVENDGKKKPKSEVSEAKPKGKKHKTLKEQYAEHQQLQQATNPDKDSGGAGAGDISASAGNDSGALSSKSYSASGKELIVGRADLSQLPKKNYLDGSVLKGMHKHQADAVNLQIEAYENGSPSFLNADGTGAGKTTEILGVASHFAKNSTDPMLIVTKNSNIIRDSFTKDAARMGLKINHVNHPDEMKSGAINICTYSAMSKMARRVSVADDKLGALAKIAWQHKDAQSYADAIGASGLTPEAAYGMFSHTGYAKTFMDNYYKDQSTCVQKAFADFHAYAMGKNRKVNFQLSSKAMKEQAKRGNIVKNHTVSDAKKTSAVLFDEAHELKNSDSGQSENGLAMMDASGKSGLFSATPLDKPEHMHYIAHAFGLEYEKVLGYAGYSVDNKGNTTTNMPIEERMNLLGNVFNNLTKNGQMVKREVSLKNMELTSHVVDMDESDQRTYNEAEAFWKEKLEMAGGGPARMNVAGQMTLAMRRLNESFKVKHITAKAIEDLKAGRQAILFFDNVGEKEKKMKLHKDHTMEYDSSINMARAHFAEELKKHPDLAHVKIAEFHGQMSAGARRAAQREFQEGKSHVFITTPKSGGTGINLDDITGNAPRSIHVATAPYSANEFIQILGRGNRVTTKSKLKVHLHVTDTSADDKNVEALVKKTKTLGASVSGDYAALKVPDKHVAQLPGMAGYEEIGDQWDSPDRPYIPMNLDSFKKEVMKSLRAMLLSMALSAMQTPMLKAYTQVGPQGGHYHISHSGKRVYESEAGHSMHKEISAVTNPDHVGKHILKMDSLNSKGALSDRDMQALMTHASNHMKSLLSAKAGKENKAREERAQVAVHKRQTTESARKERKQRIQQTLAKRIRRVKRRAALYEQQTGKIKDHYRKLQTHLESQKTKMSELEPQYAKLKARAIELRGFQERIKHTHPQYPNLVAAIKKHAENVGKVIPAYKATKEQIGKVEARMTQLREAYGKGQRVMRAYAKTEKEALEGLQKSLRAALL